MTLVEWIKNKIYNIAGLEKTEANPNDPRLVYISDDEAIKLNEIRANRVWYVGKDAELLNYYKERQNIGNFDNYYYNENAKNYFWGKSSEECKIKRIHSGIPHAIITTLVNIVGMPDINISNGMPEDKDTRNEKEQVWDKIAKINEFKVKLMQQARPLTMVEGHGAWKINFDKGFSEYPLWEYYEAENCEFIVKKGIIVGVIFKSFYTKGNDNFIMLETRSVHDGNSYIEYDLFQIDKNNSLVAVDFGVIPELEEYRDANVVLPGFNKLLAVPTRYLYDPLNPKYGRSFFDGKIVLFDFLDEVLSQASQTNRVSSPITWYSKDVLNHGPNGQIGIPELYERNLMAKESTPDGDGRINGDIFVDQPNLAFDKYGALARDVLDYIMIGRVSPASMGIDVAKKDNADAQREKEKATIMTRNEIIEAETPIVESIVELSLAIYDYMQTGNVELVDYDINIEYCEFANPSEEQLAQTLAPLLSQGAMSPEMFVSKYYGSDLSDEDRQREIEWIKSKMENPQDDMSDLAAMFGGNDNANAGPNEEDGGNALQEEAETSTNQEPSNNTNL